jgi:class 3 adenylate cyclase
MLANCGVATGRAAALALSEEGHLRPAANTWGVTYIGPTVNRAARLCAAATGGSLLIDEATYAGLTDIDSELHRWCSQTHVYAKGIGHLMCYRVNL